jgi:hypothetical protein
MATVQHLLADVSVMLDEDWDMTPIPQEARFGDTAKYITDVKKWAGGKMYVKCINQMLSRTSISTDLEADSPKAGKIQTMNISIDESDLRQLQFTLDYSIPASLEVDGSDHAVWDLATELKVQGDESLGEKRNQLIHQGLSAVKAVIDTVYDEDGTSYTSGQSDAFLKINSGSISNFKMGEIIKVYIDGTDDAYLTVNDVCHDGYFNDLAVGPGIVVTLNTTECTEKSSSIANLDTVLATQSIYSADDATNAGYPAAFDTLFLRSGTLAYFSVTDRTAKVYRFLIPYGRSFASGGSSVTVDIDSHFRVMANTMSMLFGPGKAYRRNKGYKITDSIVAIAPPDLCAEVADQAGTSSAQFTRKEAAELSDAKLKRYGIYGFTGSVLLHPSIPPIVLQPDPQAKPDTVRVFEPSAFSWIRMGSKGARPNFVPGPVGRIWHNIQNSGAITKKFRANGYVYETLFCEQPQLGYSIEDVASSV